VARSLSLPRPPAAVRRYLPLVLLLLAALALIVAEFLVFRVIRAVTVVPAGGTTTGGSHHGYALAVVGVATVPMAIGAVLGGSRPACAALVVLGAVALGIVMLVDLPTLGDAGLIGRTYDLAQAHPSTGFYVELIAAIVLLMTGLRLLLRERPSLRRSRGRRRPDRAEQPDGPAVTES
jgi:hypothetical protein